MPNRIAISAFVFLLTAASLSAQDMDAGKNLFTNRCASCHSVAKEVVGPALKDVDKRRTENWIISFVHSSQKVIQSGDTAAVALFESHNKTIMPDHPDLSGQDIKNIIAYIHDESGKIKEEPATALIDQKPYYGHSSALHQLVYLDIPGEHKPVTLRDYDVWLIIVSILVLIVYALYMAVRVNDLKRKND